MAQANRWFDRATQSMRWPQWWSEELQARQERAVDGWLDDYTAARQRLATQKQAERGVPAR